MEAADLRIAVIGGGIAGITAAHVLQRRHRVTLFEKNDYLGGHTRTIVISGSPDAGTPVDTGFIVCNDRTYPNFLRLLAQWGVPTRPSDMSFGYCDEGTGFQYAGTDLNGLFAQRRNLANPAFWAMLRGIARFGRRATADLAAGHLAGLTLGQYLDRLGAGRRFRERYLVPMGAAIWSTPGVRMLDFPAESFVRFFGNHGLLSLKDRPRWMTVEGGSHAYVRAFRRIFRGEIVLSAPVEAVVRDSGGVEVRAAGRAAARFDTAVIAAHADDALRLLADPSDDERRLLGAWSYNANRTVLHTDPAALPSQRRAWASWNFLRLRNEQGGTGPVCLSYHMNRLQGLRTEREYCVTLNWPRPFRSGSVIAEMADSHPAFTFDAMASQAAIRHLNGARRTFFCGSYLGYGFHEDAVRASLAVCRNFGLELDE
jgi:predicted NAD/FAD-binding protein